jgi:hypothetical protein
MITIAFIGLGIPKRVSSWQCEQFYFLPGMLYSFVLPG